MNESVGGNISLSARAKQVADQLGLSCDLRDYVAYFAERPSRADRDRLEARTAQNPALARRVAIWDFFFLPTLEELHNLFSRSAKDLGVSVPTPFDKHKRAEEDLRARFWSARDLAERTSRSQEEEELRALQHAREEAVRDLKEWTKWGFVAFLVGLVLLVILQAAWLILITAGAGILCWALRDRVQRVEAEYGARMTAVQQEYRKRLEQELVRLRSEEAQALSQLSEGYRELREALEAQTRRIPDGRDVLRWWQEDLEELEQQVLFRTALEPHLVDVRLGGTEPGGLVGAHLGNPIILCAPGELQAERIPGPLKLPDPWKHVKAKKVVELGDGQVELINGVYYLEALFVGMDMLGTYGCFYDFIAGLQVGERFSEQYYEDVVSVGWTADTLQLPLLPDPTAEGTISLDRVPTFTLSLSSGERFEVSIATQDYAQQVLAALRPGASAEAGTILPSIRQAAALLDAILRVLRAQLRKHKRSLEEQVQDIGGPAAE